MKYRFSTMLVALAIVLVAVPIAAARTTTGVPRAEAITSAGTILIAFEGPLTGSQASNGYDMLRGTKLAVREINQAGGVLGMQLRLIAGNDKADAATGVTVAKQLVAKHPYAVIGPYNSSVGIKNLPIYLSGGVLPVQLTSSDDTTGMGVTVQPKNSQISPVEIDWMKQNNAGKVSILWDPSSYTKGMADRMFGALNKQGVLVTKIKIDPTATDFSAVVAQALTNNPDTVYVSTYFPQGALIAKALRAEAAKGNPSRCFMGLANQDPGFVTDAGIAASARCTFSGVPMPQQFGNPRAGAYVKNFTKLFGKAPGTWGTFTYDSVYALAAAITTGNAIDVEATTQAILKTDGLLGATGPITIDPKTGNRPNVPIAILTVNSKGKFIVDSVVYGVSS